MAIRTSPYTASDLRRLTAQLERVASVARDATNFIENSGQSLFVFKKASQVTGMKQLLSFERELMDSLVAAESEAPFDAETLKTRAVNSSDNNQVSGTAGIKTASAMKSPEAIDSKEVKNQAKRASKKKAAKEAKPAPDTKTTRKGKQA